MKNIRTAALMIPSLAFLPLSALAANVKDAKCSDMAKINERVTPEYLAVVDGYDKAGRIVVEEIDVGDLVRESRQVNAQCARNGTQKIKVVRKDLKRNSTAAATAAKTQTLNPAKAKCEDFVALGEEVQPLAVYWVAGHAKAGKIKGGEVDEEFLERPIATLVQDCKAQPTASFYDKTKAWFKRSI